MKIEIDKFPVLMYNSLENHKLNDCTVVVDAQNFFYNTYKNSQLPCVFGCECDRYAEYLRKYLSMFKETNVKCFFVFKGGHKDVESRIKKSAKKYHSTAAHFKPGKNHLDIQPILMKETYKEVLDDMGFEYVICEYEAKKQCIALAQKLKCPVISFDKEICFSNVPYIPYTQIHFINDTIFCKIFRLNKLFENYGITNEKFIIFIVLKNNILPASRLRKFFAKYTSDNESLLRWLSKYSRDDAVKRIFSFLNTRDREKFLSSEEDVNAFINRQEPGGVPIDYLDKGNDIIDNCGALWFEKGVACRYIAIQYINLYRSNILWGSWAIADHEADDAMTLSLDIVKYAYNLLTNFQQQTFTLLRENGEKKEILALESPQAHRSDQSDNLFQNVWKQINGSRLFETFLIEIFGEVPLNAINQVPEDAKLLMISLAYFSRKKRLDMMNEVYSIILSYIMLGVVQEVGQGKEVAINTSCNETVIKSDCSSASFLMKDLFKLCDEEMINMFDRKLLHPLVEFQHCLEHMNFLNKLCGSPYKPTIYSKTYNGTFAYKMLYTLKEENAADGISFLRNKLHSTSTVLEYFNCLIALYKKMI